MQPLSRSSWSRHFRSGLRPHSFRPIVIVVFVALTMLTPGFTSLPPMDRDEPRFAQASKQMLESSDFVAIRFGDEARNKKPVGIYWLQALAVGTAEALGVADARRLIWLYRLPSLLGALATALLTFWAGLAVTTRWNAALSGVLMSATVLLGVEARIATTDAVLAATVTAAMGAMARAYLGPGGDGADAERAMPAAVRRLSLGTIAAFWIAVGIGILVKGPITPMVPLFAAIVLSIRSRSTRWLLRLRPAIGMPLCLLVVAPWFVLILMRTNGAFLSEAVGHDMLGKVAGAQEMHGLPPGSYLATLWLAGWPLAPFVALAIPSVWRARRDPATLVLLAWLVPAWLLFEAVPTKLFHYVLPLYPALALLAVAGLDRNGRAPLRGTGRLAATLFLALLVLVPCLVLGLAFVMRDRLWVFGPTTAVVALAAAAVSLTLAWFSRETLLAGQLGRAVAYAAAAALPVYLFAYGLLLTPSVAVPLDVSPRLARAVETLLSGSCPDPLYASVGDREPSLMFATDTRILMTDAAAAAAFMNAGPCRVAFVDQGDGPAFAAALAPDTTTRLAGRVAGIAVNGGKRLDIGIYVRQ